MYLVIYLINKEFTNIHIVIVLVIAIGTGAYFRRIILLFLLFKMKEPVETRIFWNNKNRQKPKY